jgi:hypothetical protein
MELDSDLYWIGVDSICKHYRQKESIVRHEFSSAQLGCLRQICTQRSKIERRCESRFLWWKCNKGTEVGPKEELD